MAQLTSETRNFQDFGAFSLNYSYSLSGALSSITSSLGTVGYNYDNVGRLSGVTGGASGYASNMQYRAWGDLKSVAYGNSDTITLGYNARLQVSTYELPGKMKKSYQYYDDGQLKFTQDQLLTNSKFDRLYQYDHMGRVIKALTGQEARGGATTNDRPYNETMTYDPMAHLTLRDVRNWDHHDLTSDIRTNERLLQDSICLSNVRSATIRFNCAFSSRLTRFGVGMGSVP